MINNVNAAIMTDWTSNVIFLCLTSLLLLRYEKRKLYKDKIHENKNKEPSGLDHKAAILYSQGKFELE
ncbi:MAG: hypothetical protein HRK26_03660 [Rickettsiaceae bacterium H1]|nr:hypothetical protein [Rickettsiaceae bacterium H1]